MKPNLKLDFHTLLTAALDINNHLTPYPDHVEYTGDTNRKEAFHELVNTLFWRYTSHAGNPITDLTDKEFARHLKHVRITEETERNEITLLPNL